MCLSALAIGLSPQWPLVLASNRDEYHHRPCLPLARWRSRAGTTIIGGRDLEAGGTWLGLSPAGRLALLTNVREPAATPGATSRGCLPLAWLDSQDDADTFMRGLDGRAYSGFNLVVADLASGAWHWMSNREPDGFRLRPGWQHRRLPPGLYGLSNAFLDTPWPKTLALKQAMQQALGPGRDMDSLLWQALADPAPAADDQLPRTDAPPEIERQLSSAFVRFPDGRYGTRASTLLTVRRAPAGLHIHMQEKTWLPTGQGGWRQERLTLAGPGPA